MTDLWLRQDYETDTAFDRFSRYYLPQDPPRDVNAAFRKWWAETHAPRRQGAPKVADGTWKRWAWPKDKPSWPQRAAAFDDHLARQRIAELEARAMPPSEVIAELSDIARGNMAKFADVLALVDLKNHPDAKLVHSIGDNTSISDKFDASGNITSKSTRHSSRLKLYSRLDALEKLARHYNLYGEGAPQEIISYTPDEWREERKRRKAEVKEAMDDFDE